MRAIDTNVLLRLVTRDDGPQARQADRFVDCLMLHLARKAGHQPLGTFDHALGKVEGTHKL
jgi:predicted nucleic acid-binding protein